MDKILQVIGVCAVLGAAFGISIAAGNALLAGSSLLAFPLAQLALRSRFGDYVERHVGSVATAHVLTALFAMATAIALVTLGDATGPVVLCVVIAAVAAVTSAVERVIWARYPTRLAAAGLPRSQLFFGRFAWFDRSSQPFRRLEDTLATLVLLAETAVSMTLILDVGGSAPLVTLVGLAIVYVGWSASGWMVCFRRAARGEASLRPVLASDIIDLSPQILVHFSGSIHTLYQLDQWLPLVVSSGIPCLLIARELPTFHAMNSRYDVPTVLIGEFPDLDLVVPPSARLALYVNTGTANNHLIRFDQLIHAQIHHGDSDKQPSSGKTMRLYDLHLVAGPAAVDRLDNAGILSDRRAAIVVGRPMTDALAQASPGDRGRTVLYAPTWEGFHLDSALSSVGALAEIIATAIPSDVHLVVRPHPLTGTIDRDLKRSLAKLRRLVDGRGESGRWIEPSQGPSVVQLMQDAQVLICDVSSVLVDFLAADRPAIVSDTGHLGNDLVTAYPSTAWAYRLDGDGANLSAVLADTFGEDRNRVQRAEMRERMLGYIGHAEDRFHEVLATLVEGVELRPSESGSSRRADRRLD
jgi:hypothetical protein